MGVGSNTEIRFTGSKKDLDEIFNMAYDGDEGYFYDRVMGVDSTNMTEDEESDYMEKIGVNSLCQASCSATKIDDSIWVSVYSTYDTPIGVWEKLAKDFPKVKGAGTVVREDDYEEKQGELYIHHGKVEYTPPEDIEYDEDEDEDEEEEED